MFGLGFLEIILIMCLLIILNKPEDLPGIVRRIGNLYGQLQRIYFSVIDEINNINPINPKK